MEDQSSEQPTKILLPGKQNQSDHSASPEYVEGQAKEACDPADI